MALVSTFAPLPAQIAILGSFLSMLFGLLTSFVDQERYRERRQAQLMARLQVPMALAPEHEFFNQYAAISDGIAKIARQSDPVLREFALLKLESLSEQVRSLARGTIVFSSTETWRTVYERLLESCLSDAYYSVAWAKTKDYWQDQPGRQSIRLNYDWVARGLRIERIIVLRGDLWPGGNRLPSTDIRPWIEDQQNRGITISLVHETDLGSEPDLLCDFGIYGDRATGFQELDDHSHTMRFILYFDRPSLKLARDRWERLKIYAISYPDLLDQAATRS